MIRGSTCVLGLQNLEKKSWKVDLLAFIEAKRLMHPQRVVFFRFYVPIVQWIEPRFPKPLIRVRVPVGAPAYMAPRNLHTIIRKILLRGIVSACSMLAVFPYDLHSLAPLTGIDRKNEHLRVEWKRSAGERALSSGLASLAESQYRQVLAYSAALSEEILEESTLGLAAALIAQSKFDAASSVLETIETEKSSRYMLYRAAIAHGEQSDGSVEKLSDFLDQVDAEKLSGSDQPWYFFLRGALSLAMERGGSAKEFFEKAKTAASSPEQSAFFEGLILRQRILWEGEADERILADVREKVDDFRGRPAAYPYVLEYALLLARMDRVEEAIKVLDAEQSNAGSGYSGEERSQLLLLKGMLLGVENEVGRATLKEIVRGGRGRAAMAISLQLLVRTTELPSEMLGFLSRVIAQSPSHPLIVQLYYLRGQLALSSPETASIAEEDARFLLEQYPGARELEDVYGLLAYAALQRRPAQYRRAAEYLSRLKEGSISPEESFRTNRLIGDCYFMNRDFANAVDFYRTAERVRPGASSISSIFLRLAVAEMRAGELDRAIRYVDETDFSGAINRTERWMAEWNISRALLRRGETDRARGRGAELLSAGSDDPVPTTLDLRLRWLALYLRLQTKNLEGLNEDVSLLLQRLESVPEPASRSNRVELNLLNAEVRLLLAKTMLAEDQPQEGFKILEALREAYPDSSAAERTFLAEGSYHASAGDFRAAQSVLVKLADTYPDGRQAAQALFEAALYCERRGPDHFSEAIVLLDRLVESYPDEPMVYHAGLKQGDLLRLMNDFSSAQLLFQNLINNYPEHPMRYVAELAYADCLVAIASDDSADLSEAVAILERLLDLPNLPSATQVEVGYKLGLVLKRRDDPAEAREVFTLTTTDFLLGPDQMEDIGPLGQYWLSRTILELGAILALEGETDDARRLYRKMIAFNLPGRTIASERLETSSVN